MAMQYPGMRYGSDSHYKRVGPSAEYRNIKTVYAGPGNNVDSDASLNLRVLLGDSEWGRLTDQPLWMKLRVKRTNPNYDANAAGDTDEARKKKTQKLYIQPLSNEPAVYVPPALGASAFFEKADVYLDRQEISHESAVGSLQFVYQTWNRALSRSDQRQKLGQETFIVTSDDTDNLATKSDRMKKAMRSLQSVTYKNPTTFYFEFGLDGLPFLSTARNLALSSLQEQWKTDNLTLPPGSCLDITLHKRDPFHLALEWPGISKGDYFSTGAATGTQGMLDTLEFTVEAVGLNYESTVMSAGSKIANDLQKGLLQMYFDIPKVSYSALLSGQQRLNIPIFVPAGSKVCYIGFMYGHQLWESKTSKKNLSGRTIFPPSLTNATFTLSGHENVGFRRGLEDLGTSGFASESCRAYFADLRNRGVIDWEFEEMFPKSPADKSFIQIILLDLRPYRISKNTTLHAELEFNSNLSPEQMYLVSIFVQELALYRARGSWHAKVQDG